MQSWIAIDEMLAGGIIRKNLEYLKLIKVDPINYHLKSEMEKEAILNAYQLFLKTCNFDLQILIQSKKENLSGHISNIEKRMQKEEQEEIKKISKQYIEFIQRTNIEKKSLTKTFYMIIKEEKKFDGDKIMSEKIIKENLKENYLKIKECLARCGNYVQEIKEKEEVKQVLNSFFYAKNYLNRLQKKYEEEK